MNTLPKFGKIHIIVLENSFMGGVGVSNWSKCRFSRQELENFFKK